MPPARTILSLIFAGALLLRLALVLVGSTYRIDPADNHWAFGYEMGRIGKSIATGSGFAGPMRIGSEPTAWAAPGFPVILAAIFKIFGVYTVRSAIIIYAVNSCLSALTCLLLYWVGRPIFGNAVSLVAAILFALYPPAIWHSINTIWHTSLLACVLVLFIGLLANVMNNPSYKSIVLTGLLMGIILLIDPIPAIFYPFALGLCLWTWKGHPHAIRNVATLALFPAIIFGPWMLRNYLVVGMFAPRCCVGLDLKLGNNETSWRLKSSAFIAAMHPSNSPTELALLLQMGEPAYNRYCMNQATQFIRENPIKFLELTGRKMFAWWFGEPNSWKGNLHTDLHLEVLKRIIYLLPIPFFLIGAFAARHSRSVQIILLLLLSYPLPYYVIHVNERYHFPIEPFLVLLAANGAYVTARWLAGSKGLPDLATN